MFLAWAACIIGFAIGVLGCSLLAFDRAPARRRDRRRTANPAPPSRARARAPRTVDVRGRTSGPQWSDAISGTARETLAVLRRLAHGVSPVETPGIVAALQALAARFDRLAVAAPAGAADDGTVALIELAARGARAEAARCEGVVVVTNERRAFLGALRTLRDLPAGVAASHSA